MASTSDELFEAIEGGDVGRVDAILDADPAAASSRDASGVSALMRALYRFDKALIEIGEASGRHARRLRGGGVRRSSTGSPSSSRPSRSLANAYSGDGFTALHFAAFFGRPTPRRCSSIVAPRSTPSAADG